MEMPVLDVGTFQKGGCNTMDTTIIRVIAAVLTLVVLGVIIIRRRKTA